MRISDWSSDVCSSDLLGRRKTMMISVAIFGAFTIATAWATDWWMLLALRFVTGFGLGGAPPNMIACAAEFSPSRRRALILAAVASGFPLGAALGGDRKSTRMNSSH